MTGDQETAARMDWRDFDEDPLPPLLRTAVQTFVTHGYHGTSTRTLASAANMSVPGLYHHFPSKQAIIVAIMDHAMADLWRRSEAALAEAGADLEQQLQLHIECLVLFHAHRKELAFLAATELRSLEPVARARHIAARDRQERMLVEILRAGASHGVFVAPDPRQSARAMITMCTGVSQWFDAAGPLSAVEIAADYAGYAERIVGREHRP
ncbi:TetR/AcrR family transcriptional regulator [Agromyces cerinus]|uniref:Transcriptional regulator, TetR family n=1 Tax=Agromyces cerinus subsp. cerinus TaxID=232089 RepID=A0A1N6DWS5_9MICO|nr:TetR/AcrR family transcriptional regulator [Agromyces cerinus]SIN75245.1 transcriptional regulator, TetR family [Agromyces cerinus subsp. cerinus]